MPEGGYLRDVHAGGNDRPKKPSATAPSRQHDQHRQPDHRRSEASNHRMHQGTAERHPPGRSGQQPRLKQRESPPEASSHKLTSKPDNSLEMIFFSIYQRAKDVADVLRYLYPEKCDRATPEYVMERYNDHMKPRASQSAASKSGFKDPMNDINWFPILNNFESNLRLVRQAKRFGWQLTVSEDGCLEIDVLKSGASEDAGGHYC